MRTLQHRLAHWLATVGIHCTITRHIVCKRQPHILPFLGPSVTNGCHPLYDHSAHRLATVCAHCSTAWPIVWQWLAYIVPSLSPSVGNVGIHCTTAHPIGCLGPSVGNGMRTLQHRAAHRLATVVIQLYHSSAYLLATVGIHCTTARPISYQR